MSNKPYIDGQAGTTALRLRHWLMNGRNDIDLITLPEVNRKHPDARRQAIDDADIAILCLPDDAAKEVSVWAEDMDTVIIDASTAHRVDPAWVYGLPELQAEQRQYIQNSRRISNPGCYSSSSILLLRPLVDAGLLAKDAVIGIQALSGYSGGGRALIERWQSTDGALL